MRRSFQPVYLSLLAAVGACGGVSREEVHAALAVELADSTPPEYVESSSWKVSREIYADAGGDPLWVESGAPKKRARALVEAVAAAEDQGLRTAEYDLEGLGQALQRAYKDEETTAGELAELDLRLTALYVDYGRHLLSGRLDPSRTNVGWYIRTRRAEADSTLRHAAVEEDLEKALADFLPSQPDYRTLLAARARYAAIAAQGGFPEVSGVVAPGDTGATVAAVIRRLVMEGDLDSSAVSLRTYDSALTAGIEKFRRRFGLEPGKGVDRAMVAAMNVPVDRRIRQIELNLERLRWLPNEFGARYVAVNIPDFQLHAYDEGREVLTMRVIVGDEYDGSTPVFADTMNQVVFRPYWNVPSSIALGEILPLVQRNESYLERNEYEVVPVKGSSPVDPRSVDWNDLDSTNFPYAIRQKPGPRNALGLVKFLFPNRFDIYMHDTPGDHLFARNERALSHGCIRLEHPDKFAEYVLEGMDGWTPDRIEAAMNAEEQRHVKLKRPIPVYILYLTVFARDGEVHFRPDLYDVDARGMERLGKAPPAEQIAALRAAFDELMKG
ncbi:MAG TPA: L,D-transpeptidase family protein [Gemmatimonadales bacterium]|nr:L,D-transpeptidase family protein [Gemmatimonadales bacterium]